MFERRLKILLGFVFALAAILLLRAVQLQVVQKRQFESKADDIMQHPALVDTPRGQILDRTGRPMAFDAACVDAAVDYRAIVMEPEWIKKQAQARLRNRAEAPPAGVSRAALLADEVERVKADVDGMWLTLAAVGNKTPEEIEETKQDVVRRVTLLRRQNWYARFGIAGKRASANDPAGEPWYKRWLTDTGTPAAAGAGGNDADQRHEEALDKCAVDVGEQTQSHVILADVSYDQQVELRKAMPRCPGLELKESTHRRYDPVAATVAAHLLGHLTAVSHEETTNDPYFPPEDQFRHYQPRDTIGRDGIERLAEPYLRGVKGQVAHFLGKREPEELHKAEPGADAQATIDVRLQADVLNAFKKPLTLHDPIANTDQTFADLHGAAVVIDVKTGEVLAMVSAPTYDLNRYEAEFATLKNDDLNKPLLNRATQQVLPPGSTCKTIMGAVAVTKKLLTVQEGIECDGYLKVPDYDHPGRTIVNRSHFKCWSVRLGQYSAAGVHHQIPTQAPHVGQYGNAAGFLCLSDAIERSCNVYFETVGHRLRLPGVVDALQTFGLGRPTGVGIPEVAGSIPHLDDTPKEQVNQVCWLAGIGQGRVAATPIQMANVAATLARDGVWVRPHLLRGDAETAVERVERHAGRLKTPDRVDLGLSPEGLRAIREGMIKVANSPAGTGTEGHRDDMTVAAKTGSAQVNDKMLRVPIRDAAGEIVRDPPLEGQKKGTPHYTYYPPGAFPWLQGCGEEQKSFAHAWFMGYAPAERPEVAFCVLVEYGGSGGKVAGPIAKELLDACVKYGYLHPTHPPLKAVAVGELMHDQ